MFTLIIEDKQGVVVDEYSFEDGEFIIGRSHQADIVLQSDNVSRRHARLFLAGEALQVEDLGSTNGTMVNGTAIKAAAPVALHAGNKLRIGDVELLVRQVQG